MAGNSMGVDYPDDSVVLKNKSKGRPAANTLSPVGHICRISESGDISSEPASHVNESATKRADRLFYWIAPDYTGSTKKLPLCRENELQAEKRRWCDASPLNNSIFPT